MRVGTFFFVCMMAGAGAGIAYATATVWGAWSASTSTRFARDELVAFRDVFRIPERLAAERIAIVGQLTAASAASEADRRAMTIVRHDTDLAFDTAIATTTATRDANARIATLRGSRELIVGLRADVDRQVLLSKAERPSVALGLTLQPAQQIFLDINRLLTRIQSDAVLNDAVIQDNLSLSRLAFSFRQWAAQRGTALIGAIASGKPITPGVFEELAASVGHLDEIWEQVRTAQATHQFEPDVNAAVERVQTRYFGDNGKLYDRTLRAGRGDGLYPPVADFRREHLPGVTAPFGIRDAAIVAAIQRSEGLITDATAKLLLALGLLVIVCTVIAGATWLFIRRVVGALARLTSTITRLAAREHDIDVPDRGRRDEVGAMATAIEILRVNAVEFETLSARSAQEQSIRVERAERVGALCETFHGETRATIDATLFAATQLRDGARTSSAMVEEVEQHTVAVVETTGRAADDVRAIVTSAERLGQSIVGLAEQVTISTRIAAQAERAVGQAAERMDQLTAASEKIGAVTSLIQEIAGRTNLLALNATIEAARAGEAGKGFAVVASEVKTLANQTASATGDISGQIAMVREATVGVGGVIAEISNIVAEIARLGQRVAEAMEQQQTATVEIGNSVRETANGIDAVSADIRDMRAIAARTGAATGAMSGSISRLAGDAERLSAQITTFVDQVRAA